MRFAPSDIRCENLNTYLILLIQSIIDLDLFFFVLFVQFVADFLLYTVFDKVILLN